MLIFVDHRLAALQPVRYGLSVLALPVHYMAGIPGDVVSWVHEKAQRGESLEQENKRLETEVLLLKRRLQKVAAVVAENTRLKELLNSSNLVDDRVIVAEIIGVDPDPFRHEVILNKGSTDHVFVGQAVLDAAGLMGQVVEVGPWSSRVVLVTDASHGIPVHVARNGVRAIAVGSGNLDLLRLIHVPDTADIKEGDLLVSSGLGQRFPVGYPVGVVKRVEHHPGQAFATVEAYPSAHLDRSRHVLLVFTEDQAVKLDLESEIDKLADQAEDKKEAAQ